MTIEIFITYYFTYYLLFITYEERHITAGSVSHLIFFITNPNYININMEKKEKSWWTFYVEQVEICRPWRC